MYLLSRLQKKAGMGRRVSAVTRFALSNGSSAFLTHTFIVPFHGFRKPIYLPSGDSVAEAISGLPKVSSRSMRGGRLEDSGFCWAGGETTEKTTLMAMSVNVISANDSSDGRGQC